MVSHYQSVCFIMLSYLGGVAGMVRGKEISYDASATFVECTYQFTQLHDVWAWTKGAIDHFRERQGIPPEVTVETAPTRTGARVMDRYYKLLDIATDLFDDLKINSWLVAGGLIGFLRSKAMVPWDDDVDLTTSQYEEIYHWLGDGDDSFSFKMNLEDGEEVSAFARTVPGHSSVIGVGHLYSWGFIDLETEVGIDGWVTGGDKKTVRVPFGPARVNIPVDPWEQNEHNEAHSQPPLIIVGKGQEKGVDFDKHTIRMPLTGKEGWECAVFHCPVKPTLATPYSSLSELYTGNASAANGPFHFELDNDKGQLGCTVPLDYSTCSQSTPADAGLGEEYPVAECPP